MLRNALLTGLAFVAFGLTKFLFGVLVIRWDPGLVGEINHTLSIFLLVALFFAPGLGMVVSKFASEFRGAGQIRKAQEVFTLSFLVVSVLAVVCTLVLFVFFDRVKGRVDVSPTTRYGLTPMLLLYSLYVFLRTSYYGFDRVPLYLRNELVSSAVFFGVLAVALVARSRWLVVLPFAAHSVLFVGIALADLRDQFRFRRLAAGVVQDLRRYAHFFGCTIVNSLAAPGAFHFGIILTGWLTGDTKTVGYYSVLLYSLQPLNLFPATLISVLMPTVSHSHGSGATSESIAATSRVFRPLFLLMTAIWGGGAILGWEAIRVITETTRQDLLIAFEVLLFGAYCYLISTPPSVLLNGTRHIGVIALGGAVSLGITLGLWLVVVPVYGLPGAAAGYAFLGVFQGVWAFVAAFLIFRWIARVGWDVGLTLLAAVALGALSLTGKSLVVHLAAAGAFALLFLVLHLRELREYAERILAEARAYVVKT